MVEAGQYAYAGYTKFYKVIRYRPAMKKDAKKRDAAETGRARGRRRTGRGGCDAGRRDAAAPRRRGSALSTDPQAPAQATDAASPRRAGSRLRRLRRLLIRRQNLVYVTMVGSGVFLLAESVRGALEHIGLGTAFILTGGVGFVMSLTTMDVGRSLMTAFGKEGRKTRAVIRARAERAEVRARRAEANAEANAEARAERAEANAEARAERAEANAEARAERAEANAEERNTRVLDRLDRVAVSIETMSSDNRVFFQRMLETQTRILEKLS